MPPESTENVMR